MHRRRRVVQITGALESPARTGNELCTSGFKAVANTRSTTHTHTTRSTGGHHKQHRPSVLLRLTRLASEFIALFIHRGLTQTPRHTLLPPTIKDALLKYGSPMGRLQQPSGLPSYTNTGHPRPGCVCVLAGRQAGSERKPEKIPKG